MTPLDGRDMVIVLRESQVTQHLAYKLGILVYPDPHQYEFAVVKLKPVSCPRSAQSLAYLLCGKIFGINQMVDSYGREKTSVLWVEIFIIVDASDSLPRPEALGYATCDEVGVLIWGDGDEQVTVAPHTSSALVIERRGRTAHRH